jgi:hypothetical protein
MPRSTPKPANADGGSREVRSADRKNDFPITSLGSAVQYTVTDGRNAVGIVEMIDGRYVAFDRDGTLIGRFQTLQHAVRALPYGGAP